MPLYGNELSLDLTPTTPGWAGWVALDKASDFVGKEGSRRAGGGPRPLSASSLA